MSTSQALASSRCAPSVPAVIEPCSASCECASPGSDWRWSLRRRRGQAPTSWASGWTLQRRCRFAILPSLRLRTLSLGSCQRRGYSHSCERVSYVKCGFLAVTTDIITVISLNRGAGACGLITLHAPACTCHNPQSVHSALLTRMPHIMTPHRPIAGRVQGDFVPAHGVRHEPHLRGGVHCGGPGEWVAVHPTCFYATVNPVHPPGSTC